MPMMQPGTMQPGSMSHDAMPMDHSAHMPGADDSASTRAFEEAGARMHKDMAIQYSGNTDVDFVRGMIPHHMGAVDMARVELQFGKDPELRKLAEDIIEAQDKEIAFMKAWLAKNVKE
ncbi:DUF305 domain-containing protein [Ancylobacter pratisalsi]|uniref:DUF305 domain-containing protein n=2 Tax=Ancylobacter pratisalsi TaxID=1745854 RepID=A0A6P1YRH5_9HYPH|nr:DUF305 domain-containing protein [Ancylobacter pratisalsi]